MESSRRNFLISMGTAGAGVTLTGLTGCARVVAPQTPAEPEPVATPPVPDQPGPNTQLKPETIRPVPREHLNLAMLQMAPAASDQKANLKKADAFCRKAAAGGADIALMPELWNIGYTPFQGVDPKDREAWWAQAISADSPWVGHFRNLARELDMAIGVTYLEKWPGMPRNVINLIDRHGEIVLTYAKVHTCDFSNFESQTAPGFDFPVAELDTRLGPVKVGSMICFDREFPESARILMLHGAEVILTPNACTLLDLRLEQFAVRAMENSLAVAMANYAEPFMNGRSCAYGVDGYTLLLAHAREDVYHAGVDLGGLRFYRERSIWGDAYRRPNRYEPLVKNIQMPIFKRETPWGVPFDPNRT